MLHEIATWPVMKNVMSDEDLNNLQLIRQMNRHPGSVVTIGMSKAVFQFDEA
jgi:hypothetical protein